MRSLAIIIALAVAACADSTTVLETTTPLKGGITPGSTVALHFGAPSQEPAEDAPLEQREAYVLARHLEKSLANFLIYEGHFENVVANGEPADYELRVDVLDVHLELYGPNLTSVHGDVAKYDITLEDRTTREVISAFRVDAKAAKQGQFKSSLAGNSGHVLQPRELIDISVERILEGLDS